MKHFLFSLVSLFHHHQAAKPALEMPPLRLDRTAIALSVVDDRDDSRVICVYPMPKK